MGVLKWPKGESLPPISFLTETKYRLRRGNRHKYHYIIALQRKAWTETPISGFHRSLNFCRMTITFLLKDIQWLSIFLKIKFRLLELLIVPDCELFCCCFART